MGQSLKRMLRVMFKSICYAALALLMVGLALSLVGHLSECTRNEENVYPHYCIYAGVGAFVIFIYYITIVPAILAIGGGAFLVLEMIRFGRRAMTDARSSRS